MVTVYHSSIPLFFLPLKTPCVKKKKKLEELNRDSRVRKVYVPINTINLY